MTPCIGEIRIFAGNYAPQDWALCDGSLLLIANNEALFSLLGNSFGGDGRVNFGLPDLRGRVPMGQGQGPGLPNAVFASSAGAEEATLTVANLPAHTHSFAVANNTVQCNSSLPGGNYLGTGGSGSFFPGNPVPPSTVTMSPLSVSQEGGAAGSDQNIVQPSIVLNYIISLLGVYPTFS